MGAASFEVAPFSLGIDFLPSSGASGRILLRGSYRSMCDNLTHSGPLSPSGNSLPSHRGSVSQENEVASPPLRGVGKWRGVAALSVWRGVSLFLFGTGRWLFYVELRPSGIRRHMPRRLTRFFRRIPLLFSSVQRYTLFLIFQNKVYLFFLLSKNKFALFFMWPALLLLLGTRIFYLSEVGHGWLFSPGRYMDRSLHTNVVLLFHTEDARLCAVEFDAEHPPAVV